MRKEPKEFMKVPPVGLMRPNGRLLARRIGALLVVSGVMLTAGCGQNTARQDTAQHTVETLLGDFRDGKPQETLQLFAPSAMPRGRVQTDQEAAKVKNRITDFQVQAGQTTGNDAKVSATWTLAGKTSSGVFELTQSTDDKGGGKWLLNSNSQNIAVVGGYPGESVNGVSATSSISVVPGVYDFKVDWGWAQGSGSYTVDIASAPGFSDPNNSQGGSTADNMFTMLKPGPQYTATIKDAINTWMPLSNNSNGNGACNSDYSDRTVCNQISPDGAEFRNLQITALLPGKDLLSPQITGTVQALMALKTPNTNYDIGTPPSNVVCPIWETTCTVYQWKTVNLQDIKLSFSFDVTQQPMITASDDFNHWGTA